MSLREYGWYAWVVSGLETTLVTAAPDCIIRPKQLFLFGTGKAVIKSIKINAEEQLVQPVLASGFEVTMTLEKFLKKKIEKSLKIN